MKFWSCHQNRATQIAKSKARHAAGLVVVADTEIEALTIANEWASAEGDIGNLMETPVYDEGKQFSAWSYVSRER